MKHCPACRNEVPDDAQFCGFCGFRLTPITSTYAELARRSDEAEGRSSDEPEQPHGWIDETSELSAVDRDDPDQPHGWIDETGELSLSDPSGIYPPIPLTRKKAEGAAGGAQVGRESDPIPLVSPKKPGPLPDHRQGASERSAQRFPMKVEVNYTSEHNFYAGFAMNISSGGLFVATFEPSARGQLIEVTFTIPGIKRPVSATCEVKWVREYNPDSDSPPGMGLSFVDLDPELTKAIDAFIKHRDPIFFEE